MIARIFDKTEKKYYVSEVYGILNCGTDKYIVDRSEDDREHLSLVQAMDFSTPPYEMIIEGISDNDVKLPWICVNQEEMKDFNGWLRGKEDYHYFRGYQLIWGRQKPLVELVMNGIVRKKDLLPEAISTKLTGWNYIETEEDIHLLMKEFGGFHDSVIREVHYISGDYKLPEGGMCFTEACQKNLQMIFDSDWSDSIEIIFEAPRLLQLVPPGENYLADLYDASIFLKDCMVFFYDSYRKEQPDVYEGTYVKAMGMRWRKV